MTGRHATPLTSFIDGASASHEGEATPLVAPETGRNLYDLIEAPSPIIDAAVASASSAFREHRRAARHQRAAWLRQMASGLAGCAEDVAQMICEDVGKPIRVCRVEVRRGVEFIEATASAILDMAGEVIPLDAVPLGARRFGFTQRIPYGVVGAITPFNAPVNLLVQKIAPAIAAGNSTIAKPAPAGARTALALARIFTQAGLPNGLLNILTGDRKAAVALASHEGVRAVTFTGGTAAGDALIRAAGNKKFVSELGSNAANVVLGDADVEDAAPRIAAAAFEASGQQCISAQRIIVDRTIHDRFLEAFVQAAGKLVVGAASDPATDVGPMVNEAAATRVMEMCKDAIDRGARFALEPRRERALVSPAVIADIARDSRLWREEAFGPVAVVLPFDTIDEALDLANDSPFGLQGAVFTRSIDSAFRFSQDFDVGAMWINEASRFRLDMYPFGGVKSSGTGREGVRYAIEELSQIKFTGIRL